jgi:MoaA/NifB/PqqE/SkfB family radical SAM enzyme
LGREHGIMSFDNYKRSLDEVIELGCQQIVLTGFGEPLVDKQLEKKVEYAKGRGLRTYIISNGSLLTKKRATNLIQAGLDELRISFYGMRKETYETVMVGLKFDVTMKNLLGFLDLREELGFKRPRLELNWLELPENAGDTEAFQEYWEPRADAIEIWKPHNFGDGRSYRERFDEVALKNTCGRPENGPLQIQWNGEVIPCCYDYNNQIVLGNAFEQPVLEILNGEKYELLRLAHREKKFALFPFCNQCDQLLEHADALVYTNRHNLPKEVAVKMSNTDLYNLVDDKPFDDNNFSEKYADGLVETESPKG